MPQSRILLLESIQMVAVYGSSIVMMAERSGYSEYRFVDVDARRALVDMIQS
nr:hypothetical protein [uncultured Shimia sp.]